MDLLTPTNDGALLQPRDYQLEMLTDSLQRNIIVAMDTGSGKTQVAILRIAAELERSSPEKLVWFVVPTKTLAEQQYHVLCTQLPSVQCRLLTGSDGVDRWSDQWIWDEILSGIRVVVSTHQVLLDALIHGFVPMTRLALLVFDEAHSCILDHPSNRIMRDFYFPNLKAHESAVPHILGLTASPIINDRVGALRTIERNMNSICRTPKLHREQLLQFVHRPSMRALKYSQSEESAYSSTIQSLKDLYASMDIEDDPYVLQLRAAGHGYRSKQLREALLNRRTYCQDHIRHFINMAKNVFSELGSWAVDFYVSSCLQKFQAGSSSRSVNFDALEETEKAYLRNSFAKIQCNELDDSLLLDDSNLTPKVHCLIEAIVGKMNGPLTGLVFVDTRASAVVLAHLLSVHPRTRDTIKAGSFVGTSTFDQRKSNIGELVDSSQGTALDDLRNGKRNLIVATSVLEEGIDVSACNVVICFAKPPHLKSFIQRRGRARHSKSAYMIMFGEQMRSAEVNEWQMLEEQMKDIYMDDMRRLDELRSFESVDEGSREFIVESTGAKLTLLDSVQHLHVFCSSLPATRYVDLRPIFTFEGNTNDGILAKVTMPKSVDISVREFHSSRSWKTEVSAKRDAAFEAYVALYRAGLVNANLLPLIGHDEAEASAPVEKRERLVICAEQLNPWPRIASAWLSRPVIHEFLVRLRSNGRTIVQMILFSPIVLPPMLSIDLYWDAEQSFTVDVCYGKQQPYDDFKIAASLETTHLILRSIHANRMRSDPSTLPLLFTPFQPTSDPLEWLRKAKGTSRVATIFKTLPPNNEIGIIRDLRDNGKPHIFHSFEYRQEDLDHSSATPSEDNTTEECLHVKVRKLPKRSDFLHKIPIDASRRRSGSEYVFLTAGSCEMDRLPWVYSQFAMFIPSIMHRIGVSMITAHLCENLLSSLEFENKDLVTTAISASVSREANNYQRLEFLGDGILKFLTSINLMSKHLNWHEGYLAHKKDHIVSNSNLAKAAQNVGLDKYILTKSFTGYKWRPLYNRDILEAQPPQTRELSTKVLADVVEALIGAAYLDGGHRKALICLSIFLPKVDWLSLSQCHQNLSRAANAIIIHFPPHFAHLEELVGHVFHSKPLLLEALTYASYIGLGSTPSYERLEYVGDAILDLIITTKVFDRKLNLSHQWMHHIRTCLVNANFLAFHCMSLSLPLPRVEIIEEKFTGSFSAVETAVPRYIWQFMRHSHMADVVVAQQRCLSRFDELRSSIQGALSTGQSYPWTLLSMFDAEKFFSDIVESLLGAIYIDTFGSLPACEAFLAKLGIMEYLDRVMNEKIHLLHPKEELGILAVHKEVKYENWSQEEGPEGEKGGWFCRVWIGQREFSVVGQGRNRMEAETRGAEEAVKILKGEKDEKGESSGVGEDFYDAEESM